MRGVSGSRRAAGAAGRPRAPFALTLAAVAALYVLDALVLGQGFIAAALLLAGAAVVPKWLLLARVGRNDGRAAALATLLLASGAGAMFTINANNRLAQARADDLVERVQEYRALAGRFPATLDELVPAYVASVPRAKYTLGFGHFDYSNSDGGVFLAYASAPPFGREVYDFRRQRWRAD
ncbi:MAG: hypothetical protein ACU85V_15510 [Gammaproteobacteria bacterium]